MILKRSGQSAVEAVTLAIIVMAAILTAGVYVKRGIQGRWKAAVDEIGDQYDPAYMNTRVVRFLSANSSTHLWAVPAGGNAYYTMRRDASNSVDAQSGYSRVGSRP